MGTEGLDIAEGIVAVPNTYAASNIAHTYLTNSSTSAAASTSPAEVSHPDRGEFSSGDSPILTSPCHESGDATGAVSFGQTLYGGGERHSLSAKLEQTREVMCGCGPLLLPSASAGVSTDLGAPVRTGQCDQIVVDTLVDCHADCTSHSVSLKEAQDLCPWADLQPGRNYSGTQLPICTLHPSVREPIGSLPGAPVPGCDADYIVEVPMSSWPQTFEVIDDDEVKKYGDGNYNRVVSDCVDDLSLIHISEPTRPY